MILTGKEIARCVNNGSITIDPFDRKQLNPNSYNLRLGNLLLVYSGQILDMQQDNRVDLIWLRGTDGIVLLPGRLYLGCTTEVIGSEEFVPIIDGRSSVGRLGINIHATAGYGDLGFKGSFTLELSVVQPVRIYPNVQIAQVRFQTVQGAITKYKGKYNGQSYPRTSRLFKEFKQGVAQ